MLVQAAEGKAGAERQLALHSQYERMLHDYAEFLDTAQTKLASDVITASDIKHLQQQAKAHKVCFYLCHNSGANA